MRAQLAEVMRLEIYGREAFSTMGALTLSRRRKDQIKLLVALEQQTLDRVATHLGGKPPRDLRARVWKLRGLASGIALRALPWKTVMRLIAQETHQYIRMYEQMCEAASAEDRDLCEYLLHHETAIREFSEAEAAERTNSIAPIRQLISP